MKYFYLWTTALLLSASIFSSQAAAQCSHDPTVTPANLILCPNTTDTLWTQVYDSYQWYKDGNLIPGATQQFLEVDANNDVGSSFSVEATLAGCTEMSPDVLLDGWMFLPLFVMHQGDFQIGNNGESLLCFGDTMWLISSYDNNVQWTNNGAPIQGATSDTLVVTQSGNYSVSAAPATCPDFIMQLGLTLEVIVSTPPVPVISFSNGELVVTPTGYTYQWYKDGDTLTGVTGDSIVPPGEGDYTVELFDSLGCSAMSDVYQFTYVGIDNPGDVSVNVFPNPTDGFVNISGLKDAVWTAVVTDLAGRKMWETHGSGDTQVPLQWLETGNYVLTISVPKTGQVISKMIRKN